MAARRRRRRFRAESGRPLAPSTLNPDAAASGRRGNNLKGCQDFYLEAMALECLTSAMFARQLNHPRSRWGDGPRPPTWRGG